MQAVLPFCTARSSPVDTPLDGIQRLTDEVRSSASSRLQAAPYASAIGKAAQGGNDAGSYPGAGGNKNSQTGRKCPCATATVCWRLSVQPKGCRVGEELSVSLASEHVGAAKEALPQFVLYERFLGDSPAADAKDQTWSDETYLNADPPFTLTRTSLSFQLETNTIVGRWQSCRAGRWLIHVRSADAPQASINIANPAQIVCVDPGDPDVTRTEIEEMPPPATKIVDGIAGTITGNSWTTAWVAVTARDAFGNLANVGLIDVNTLGAVRVSKKLRRSPHVIEVQLTVLDHQRPVERRVLLSARTWTGGGKSLALVHRGKPFGTGTSTEASLLEGGGATTASYRRALTALRTLKSVLVSDAVSTPENARAGAKYTAKIVEGLDQYEAQFTEEGGSAAGKCDEKRGCVIAACCPTIPPFPGGEGQNFNASFAPIGSVADPIVFCARDLQKILRHISTCPFFGGDKYAAFLQAPPSRDETSGLGARSNWIRGERLEAERERLLEASVAAVEEDVASTKVEWDKTHERFRVASAQLVVGVCQTLPVTLEPRWEGDEGKKEMARRSEAVCETLAYQRLRLQNLNKQTSMFNESRKLFLSKLHSELRRRLELNANAERLLARHELVVRQTNRRSVMKARAESFLQQKLRGNAALRSADTRAKVGLMVERDMALFDRLDPNIPVASDGTPSPSNASLLSPGFDASYASSARIASTPYLVCESEDELPVEILRESSFPIAPVVTAMVEKMRLKYAQKFEPVQNPPPPPTGFAYDLACGSLWSADDSKALVSRLDNGGAGGEKGDGDEDGGLSRGGGGGGGGQYGVNGPAASTAFMTTSRNAGTSRERGRDLVADTVHFDFANRLLDRAVTGDGVVPVPERAWEVGEESPAAVPPQQYVFDETDSSVFPRLRETIEERQKLAEERRKEERRAAAVKAAGGEAEYKKLLRAQKLKSLTPEQRQRIARRLKEARAKDVGEKGGREGDFGGSGAVGEKEFKSWKELFHFDPQTTFPYFPPPKPKKYLRTLYAGERDAAEMREVFEKANYAAPYDGRRERAAQESMNKVKEEIRRLAAVPTLTLNADQGDGDLRSPPGESSNDDSLSATSLADDDRIEFRLPSQAKKQLEKTSHAKNSRVSPPVPNDFSGEELRARARLRAQAKAGPSPFTPSAPRGALGVQGEVSAQPLSRRNLAQHLFSSRKNLLTPRPLTLRESSSLEGANATTSPFSHH